MAVKRAGQFFKVWFREVKLLENKEQETAFDRAHF